MAPAPQPSAAFAGGRIVRSADALAQLQQELQRTHLFALDVRTAGADPLTDPILAVDIATPQAGYTVDVQAVSELGWLVPLLQDPERLKVLHDGKRVLRFLAEHLGYKRPFGTLCRTLFDTYIAARLLGEDTAHDVASLVRRHLDEDLQRRLGAVFETHGAAGGAAAVAPALLPLRRVLREQLIRAGMVSVAKLEFDLVPVMADMEHAGIYLNLEAWERTWEPIRRDRARLAEAVRRSLGARMEPTLFGGAAFNPDSPQQTLEALRRLGLDLPHTGESLLKEYAGAYPEVRDLLAYRTVAKLCSSCGDLLPQYVHPKTGRIHAHYEQIGARTGRMSCSDPNIQQVPRQKAIRACFQAEPGNMLVTADYSQIELRVAAALAQDPRMIEAYRSGQDLHRLTASLITHTPLEQVDGAARQAAKAVNFGLLYAMGAQGLAKYARTQYGVALSLEQAEAFRNRFFAAYTGLRRWHEAAKQRLAQARHAPAEVRSVAGRRYLFTAESNLAAFLNAPVQGSAADVMKRAMVRVHEALFAVPGARIVGVVHDELLVEAPQEEAERVAAAVRAEMEAAAAEFFPDVPFVAEAQVVPGWD